MGNLTKRTSKTTTGVVIDTFTRVFVISVRARMARPEKVYAVSNFIAILMLGGLLTRIPQRQVFGLT